MKWWWQVLAVFLAVVGLLAAGWCSSTAWHLKHGNNAPKTDTLIVVKWDTLRIDNPVEIIRWRETRDTILVAITDTLLTRDTLFVPMPREVAQYSDSTYKAQVSGVSPRLDWIEVYPKTIEKTIVRTEEAGRWGIGPQVGIGLSPKGVAVPYVGIGVQYNLLTF